MVRRAPADYALDGLFTGSKFERAAPARQHQVEPAK
jgi:hypothetical protein